MKSTEKLNSRLVIIAIVKILAIFLGAEILSRFWYDELHRPIIYGSSESKLFPIDILTVYVCLFSTMQIVKLLRSCFWEYYLPKKRHIRVSTLLVGLVNFCIYLLCIFVVCRSVFQLDIGNALAATGAVGVVLGFGLQKMFLDLFVGISIDMDKSFRIGDWITLKNAGTDVFGEINQMNWRVISVKTAENIVHQIPNSIFGQQIVTNLSRPTPDSEFELYYCIPSNFNENKVIKTITHGLDAVGCTGVITDYKCRINKTTIDGVLYKVKYFINPVKCGPGKARHLIHSRVFRFLRAAGITLSNTDQRTYLTQVPLPAYDPGHEIANQISKIDLFQTLTEKEVSNVALSTTARTFNKGDIICRQGEEGRSLFIVREGFLKVFITNDAGAQQQVAVLIPEDFFGEMSLLTGDKRSATIIAESQVILYEIEADALASLFASNDKFPQILSKIITERNASNNALAKTPEEEVAQVSKLRELEMRIMNFSRKLLGLKG
ncbi:MAG: mechanosensitive ion channel family protein [Pseudomonadota bacterium]